MSLSIKVNEKCLVRHQDCKRIFGGSRSCFVACPNSEEIALELEIVRQKLREVNIEPYIAVDQRDFQKDIFCEKICAKIIESQFCIVILNDVVDPKNSIRIPNANVYYEYGLITAFRKRIIPVQLAGQSLAFNIQSLDTLKYHPKDFSRQIEEAIKITILNLEAEQIEKDQKPDQQNIEWALDFMGLVRSDERQRLRHERILSSRSLGFEPFTRPWDDLLFYVGIFNIEDSERDVIVRAKMLTLRINNYCIQLGNELAELKKSTISRSRGLAEGRIADIERLRTAFAEAVLLVAKADISDPKRFSSAYQSSVEEIGLSLKLEVLDDSLIKKLLEPHINLV